MFWLVNAVTDAAPSGVWIAAAAFITAIGAVAVAVVNSVGSAKRKPVDENLKQANRRIETLEGQVYDLMQELSTALLDAAHHKSDAQVARTGEAAARAENAGLWRRIEELEARP